MLQTAGVLGVVPSPGLLFGLMLGDLGEGLFGGIGTTLLSLSYSREAEAEADRVALALLDDTGIGAQGLAVFCERLAEEGGKPPAAAYRPNPVTGPCRASSRGSSSRP